MCVCVCVCGQTERFKCLLAFCFVSSPAVCAVGLLGANAEIKFTIPVGRFFTYELMRETFQNDFEPLSKLYGEKNPIMSIQLVHQM